LHQPAERPLVFFIGAIGYDNNKGLDTLLSAWSRLCFHAAWDADLVVIGDGRALPRWRSFAAKSDFAGRVRFLGFSDRIPDLLAAADLLVSAVRYESYGLNVHEALCRGVPAIVSAGAGVAERYPSYLRDLLLPDPEDIEDLVTRMLTWRSNVPYWQERVGDFSKELRTYSWRDMAERIYELAIRTAPQTNEALAVPAVVEATER
jgi:glycosyltransferase involved in cell wall biosynthesis